MRHYETMFIVRPTLAEDEIRAKIEFYKDAIIKNGGEITTVLDMGMRHLAYEIKKNKRGYYFVVYFRAAANLVLELERLYRISEDILRFIIIKYEKSHEIKNWETLVARANKKVTAPENLQKHADPKPAADTNENSPENQAVDPESGGENVQ